MAHKKSYGSIYERLVANTEEPQSENGCWIWSGPRRHGYGALCVRVPGLTSPRHKIASRAMLSEVHGVDFPFDECGHLCGNPSCVNPDHLEIQSQAFNLSERRGYADVKKDRRMIPVLFPRRDPLQEAADAAWDEAGTVADKEWFSVRD